jgi:hypothetical protein
MWKSMKLWTQLLFWPWVPRTEPIVIRKTLDFINPSVWHWAGFDYGDNYEAHFTIRGMVARGDYILVRLRSGRIGRYQLYSVLPDFTGTADYKAIGAAVGYHSYEVSNSLNGIKKPALLLLAKNPTPFDNIPRGPRPYSGELSNLSSGAIVPASDVWKLQVRNEARGTWAGSMRAASDL